MKTPSVVQNASPKMLAFQDARKRLGVSEFFELPVPARCHIYFADAKLGSGSLTAKKSK